MEKATLNADIVSIASSWAHDIVLIEVMGGTIYKLDGATDEVTVFLSGLSELAFLTVGTDFKLYRIRGKVGGYSTIEVYEITPQPTCDLVKQANPGAATGVHAYDPDDGGPLPARSVYCDFDTLGGPWTLCMRANQTSIGKSRYRSTFGAGEDIATTTESGGINCHALQNGPGTDYLFKDAETGKYIAALGLDLTLSAGNAKDCFQATAVVNASGFPDLELGGFEIKHGGDGAGQHLTNFLGADGCSCNAINRALMINAQYPDGAFRSWRDHVCGGGGPDYDDVGSGHIEVYVRASP